MHGQAHIRLTHTHIHTHTRTLIHTTLGSSPCTRYRPVTENCLPDNNTARSLETQTSLPCAGFEPGISIIERPLIYALDRAASGIDVPQMTSFLCRRNLGSYTYTHKISVYDPTRCSSLAVIRDNINIIALVSCH